MPLSLYLVAILGCGSTVGAQWDASRFALYTSDAGTDFASALPIGNGRIGAAVFGTAVEKIVLNDNSLWSGPWMDRANPASKDAVFSIRQMLQSGSLSAAGQSAMNNMASNPSSPRAYNPLVDMGLDFDHGTKLSAYTRWLDTHQGTTTVTYTHSGVNFT